MIPNFSSFDCYTHSHCQNLTKFMDESMENVDTDLTL